MSTFHIVSKKSPTEDGPYFVGTGFFISPTILVTAAHAVCESATIVYGTQSTLKSTRVSAPRDIFTGTPGVMRLEFKVLKRIIESGPPRIDIAILKVSEGIRWGQFIHIDVSVEDRNIGDRVDVLGYPRYNEDWFNRMHPQLTNPLQGFVDAIQTLQTQKLNISTGSLLSVGEYYTYRLSSSPGMSGGPVMCGSKAIGESSAVSVNSRGSCRYSER